MLKFIKIITISQSQGEFMNFLAIDKVIKNKTHIMNNLHSHAHYELYFLTQGQRTYFFHNTLYNLQAPACIIIPPFTLHKTEGGAYERFNINVLPKNLNDIEQGFLQNKSTCPLSFENKTWNAIICILNLLLKLQENNDNLNEYMSHALFDTIIAFISDTKQTTDAFHSNESLPVILLKIMDYFDRHYKEKITLDSLSTEFFISKNTIIYNFKKHFNTSPMNYLLDIRISKAKKLLLSKQKISIEKLSELCGFSSANYFTECFKQKEGISPTAFRKFLFQEK